MTELIHWANIISNNLINKYPNKEKYIISTGITPSGKIHVGNMREVLTADLIYKSIIQNKENLNKKIIFYYIADTYDPLRKVYPFLNEEIYTEHVGKPLSEIPCPCLKHKNYAEHFLDPFIKSMNLLDIHPIILRTDELYKNGFFDDLIITSLENRDKISKILYNISGKEEINNWSPFNPLCSNCHKINKSIVTGYNKENKTINYKCKCGYEGTNPIRGGGKLTWRVEWPAKWKLLNVTLEPFGKDHASSGGSYESGVEIIRNIFNEIEPEPIKYEWILLENKGAMSSSSGVVISIDEMLDVVPPEVMRYLIARTKPEKHIKFDPGIPLLNLIEEYEKIKHKEQKTKYEKDLINLCSINNTSFFNDSFQYKQLVTIYQVANGNINTINEILNRNNIIIDENNLLTIMNFIRIWLNKYSPDCIKFGIEKEIPISAFKLTYYQKSVLKILGLYLLNNKINTAEDIQKYIYDMTKKDTEIYLKVENEIEYFIKKNNIKRNKNIENVKSIFEAIYIAILGKENGPKIGWFLLSLDKKFLQDRFFKVFDLNVNCN